MAHFRQIEDTLSLSKGISCSTKQLILEFGVESNKETQQNLQMRTYTITTFLAKIVGDHTISTANAYTRDALLRSGY